jgi:hypothetical protein
MRYGYLHFWIKPMANGGHIPELSFNISANGTEAVYWRFLATTLIDISSIILCSLCSLYIVWVENI